MLPFLRRPWNAKTRTQSSEHGVVATDKHGLSLKRLLVEGHVGLLGGPESMEQDGELTGYRNDWPYSWPAYRLGQPDADPIVGVLSPFREVGGYPRV
jgi:hypothetical protein